MTVPREMLDELAQFTRDKNRTAGIDPEVAEEAIQNLEWLLNSSEIEKYLRYNRKAGDASTGTDEQKGIRIWLSTSKNGRQDFLAIGEKSRTLKLEALNDAADTIRGPANSNNLNDLKSALGARLVDEGTVRIYFSPVSDAADRDALRAGLQRFIELALPVQAAGKPLSIRRPSATLLSSVARVAPVAGIERADSGKRMADAATNDSPEISELDEDILACAPEGRKTLRFHLSGERSRSLRQRKVKQVRLAAGKLECEVCSFDFETVFPDIGEGFCEVHHLRPIATLTEDSPPTDPDELAIVCSNCHRMLHKRALPYGIEELRNLRGGVSSARRVVDRQSLS